MRSYQLGSYDSMILNFIESYSGYLQVQNVKYQDNPSVDYSFEYSDSLATCHYRMLKMLFLYLRILNHLLLLQAEHRQKGLLFLAIDPEMERKFSNPENKLVKYRITKESVKSIKRIGKYSS